MTDRPIQIAVLGSTGSIGRSTLEVVEASEGRLRAAVLLANRSVETLLQQAHRHRPDWLIVADAEQARLIDPDRLPEPTRLEIGCGRLPEILAETELDIVVSAVVGSAGLQGTWAALEAGKTVALANKETLVMAGRAVTDLAAARGARILPIDSEHSALFQVLQGEKASHVRRLILTASGGPFRNFTAEQLAQVTVRQALDHPTWEMGPKITVDSATMMNKALEIIEARWLFDVPADRIDVVIHPQSIVHSMVEFVDGSVVAQMGRPDMKLPIQYALTYPERRPCPSPRLDFGRALDLHFEPPDAERFPALALGREVARSGGSAGAVLNAANEAAVACFLEERLPFHRIVPACRAILDQHDFEPHPTLEDLIRLDRWARLEVSKWVVLQ